VHGVPISHAMVLFHTRAWSSPISHVMIVFQTRAGSSLISHVMVLFQTGARSSNITCHGIVSNKGMEFLILELLAPV
jgi:hypothetical protein